MMEKNHEEILGKTLDRIIERNRSFQSGTPMSELKEVIEKAISSLPPLDFEAFNQAMEDKSAAEKLIQRAPEMIGWDAKHLVQWIENLTRKMN